MSEATRQDQEQSTLNDSASQEKYIPEGAKAEEVTNTMTIKAGDSQVQAKEVVVMKKWEDGTVYYIDPDHLDTIDRKRLIRALQRAERSGVELWLVLKDTALSNGSNGLDYFHQLTQTFRPDGETTTPSAQQVASAINRDAHLAIERAGPLKVG